jgi:FkbM family methyltransferase
MANSNLIYDIGFHKGEDTGYYLYLGYNVIGVDADPGMTERAHETFKSACDSGKLEVLNLAVSDEDGKTAELNISEWSYWNSLKKDIANRDGKAKSTVSVPTTRLDTLMRKYGVPYYCKIDVEGFDALAAATLLNSGMLPEFISVETECVGDSEELNDAEALRTLDVLYSLGYNRFKLVDQSSLCVLDQQHFYNQKEQQGMFGKLTSMLSSNNRPTPGTNIERLKKKHGFDFALYSSGPFGNDLEGSWSDYETAKKILLMHRKDFFSNPAAARYAFWCDWHATCL